MRGSQRGRRYVRRPYRRQFRYWGRINQNQNQGQGQQGASYIVEEDAWVELDQPDTEEKEKELQEHGYVVLEDYTSDTEQQAWVADTQDANNDITGSSYIVAAAEQPAIVHGKEERLAMFEDAIVFGDISIVQNIVTQQDQLNWWTSREPPLDSGLESVRRESGHPSRYGTDRELQERGKRRKPAVVANPIMYGEGPLVSDKDVLQMENALGELQRKAQKQTHSTGQSHITALFLHMMTGCLTGRRLSVQARRSVHSVVSQLYH
jgi:hypothetical protein